MMARASNITTARKTFVDLLDVAKRTHGRASDGEGPNKVLARKMRISPARLGDFLKDRFELDLGGKEIFEEARLQKAIAGFATSVERALSWLRAENIDDKVHTIDATSIIRAYFPSRFDVALKTAVVEQAIRDGLASAKTEIESSTKIDVELWIPGWGPFAAKSQADVERSFYTHYGRAIFRGVDPLNTRVVPKVKPLNDALNRLPARVPGGNWAVTMGVYATLDRRWRNLDFVTFPALRFPLVGLILSGDRLPDKLDVTVSFSPLREFTSDPKSLLDSNFKRFPRFVASNDEPTRRVLYSMFQEDADVKPAGIETLPVNENEHASTLLFDEIKKRDSTIAFLADGMLAFEVFARLREKNIDIRVISQDRSDPEFVFAGGMMFKQQDHQLAELLEASQQQLFRTPQRVAGLLEEFVGEVDRWIVKLQLTPKSEWPDNAPIFLYAVDEIKAYVKKCYVTPELGQAKANDAAEGIYRRVMEYVGKKEVENPAIIGKLFKPTTEMEDESKESVSRSSRE